MEYWIALWDHPHHWIRLALFQNATNDIFGSNISFVIEEKIGLRVKESASLFNPKSFFTITETIDRKYFELADKLLIKTKNVDDFLIFL